MLRGHIPECMILLLTPRVPILGRNLFNHAKRVGVSFLGTVTTVLVVLLDCSCFRLELLLLDVIILLDENERVNPRRRDFADVDEDKERTL